MQRTASNTIQRHEPVIPRVRQSPEPEMQWTPQDFVAEPEGIDWRRIRSAVVRHRWMIMIGTLIGAGAGLVVSKFLKPKYEVSAMIWIDQDPRRAGGTLPLSANQSFEASAWTDLVRSAQVLDTVVRAKGLNVYFGAGTDTAITRSFSLAPEYRTGKYEVSVKEGSWILSLNGSDIATGALGDSIGVKQGFRWVLPVGTPDDEISIDVVPARDAAKELGDDLGVKLGPEGSFLRLGLSGSDPKKIADVLNAVADRYVVVAADLRKQKLGEVATVLGARTAEAATALRQAEDQFQAHRVRAITQPSDPLSSPTTRGGDPAAVAANAQLLTNQRDRDEITRVRTVLDRARTGSEVDITRLEGLAVAQSDPELAAALKELGTKKSELRTLTYRYSPEYPAVVRLQEEIDTLRRGTIPALSGRLSQALAARQAELDTEVRREAGALRAMPGRAVEDARLRRNVDMAQTLYASLQSRFDAARVADESTLNTVRVLDQAVAPESPSKNMRLRVLGLAVFMGLGLSVAGAMAHDKVDPRVRYPKQVTTEMGLAVLGALPHVPHDKNRDPSTDAAMVEALRGVRLNLVYANGASGPLMFTVSSPGSSDGKSFLSSNLARTFAESGQRTILVDGDLRRGMLHRRLSHHRRPGLSDYLLGNAELSQVIRKTAFDGFDFIPCGTRAVDAPELLGRAATAQLLWTLRSEYDVVICDSPPLTAGIDAFVLGAATGNLVVVLRAGVSVREMVSQKLDVIDRMPIKILGAVLNDVRDRSIYNSYSYYLPGYEATDEMKDATARPPVLL